MLDRDVFKQRMTVLGQVFEKMPSAEALVVYYRALQSRMTTEQFERACDRVIMECRFFPVPAEIIAKASSNDGELIWARVISAADRNHPVELSPEANFALRSVGGLKSLRESPVKDRHWLKQDFLAFLKAAPHMEQGLLPAATVLNSLPTAQEPLPRLEPAGCPVGWEEDVF